MGSDTGLDFNGWWMVLRKRKWQLIYWYFTGKWIYVLSKSGNDAEC